jgi:PAS domain S-box-containing protein
VGIQQPDFTSEAIRSLFRLTDRLYRSKSLPDAFAASLDAMTELLGCERASILTFDSAGVMTFRAWRGLSDRYRQAVTGHTPWKQGEPEPEPIFVPDIRLSGEPDWLKEELARENIVALGFAPLTVNGHVFGKFMTYYAQPREFGAADREAAVGIARQLSFCLDRAMAEAERIRNEVQLRHSEERFRAMVESAPVMLWVSDASGRCAFLNRQLRQFWGVDEGDVKDFDWRTTMHPEDADRIGQVMMQGLQQKVPVRVKGRYLRSSDRSFRVLETLATPSLGANGTLLGMLGVNVDVTEREEAARALAQSEARFRYLADTMPQLVWTADGSGRLNYWNSRIKEYAGAAVQDGGQLSWERLLHPDDLAATSEVWNGALLTSEPYQVTHRLLMADGGYRWHLSRATPVVDEGGAVIQWYGTATDVHDLRKAQDRLRESEQRQRIAVVAAGLGVFEWDIRSDKTIWENPRMFEIFGRRPEDGVPSKEEFFEQYVHPDDLEQLDGAFQAALQTAGQLHLTFRYFRRGEAVPRWLEVAGNVEQDETGRAVRLVGVVADVTERRRSEEHKSLLIDELNHRVKNTLALVQSIARQTFRSGGTGPGSVSAFEGRLAALAHAHNLLSTESWEQASLGDLARKVLGAGPVADPRIRMDGPTAQLLPKQAVTVTMALHELYTNAVKHGALRDEHGTIDLQWSLFPRAADRQLTLRWIETSPTPIAPPARSGFGTVMIKQALEAELNAQVEMSFLAAGLTCTIAATLPSTKIAAQ